MSDDDRRNPRPVQVTRAADVKTGHGQTEGMIRQVSTAFSRISFPWCYEPPFSLFPESESDSHRSFMARGGKGKRAQGSVTLKARFDMLQALANSPTPLPPLVSFSSLPQQK